MHIVIITGPFLPPPPGPAGAVERVWYGLAPEFVRRGHRVTFICRSPPGPDRETNKEGVEIIRVAGPDRPRRILVALIKDFWFSRRVARVVPKDADIVVTNGFWQPVMVRKRRGRPLVMPNVQRMPKGQLRLYSRADRLLVVSEAVRDSVAAESPGLIESVRVIPNPINTEVFRPTDQAPRILPTILYAGRIHPEKGIGLLIAAARIITNSGMKYRLRIVGPWSHQEGGGGEAYLAQLKRESEGLPVEFEEPIYDRCLLANLYRDADIFCYPSVADAGETFGVAPLEAMACGTAVVVSGLVCFHDFLRPGINGLSFDHRAEQAACGLADALSSLLDDDGLRRKLGALAALTAETYSYPRVAVTYLQAFEEALNG